MIVAQSDAQRDGNTLLLWVGDEIMSVGEVTALGGGAYQVYTSRARYESLQAAHASGSEAWFVFRAQMPRAEQEGTIVAGATLFAKLVTHNATDDQSLADALAVEFLVATGSAVATPGSFVVQTDVEVGSDSKLYSHLHAYWTSPADAAITGWEVRYRPASGTDADWVSVPASSPESDIQVQPGVAYLVQVRAFSTFGESSGWTGSMTITSAKAAPFAVTGLQLVDGKTTNIFMPVGTPSTSGAWATRRCRRSASETSQTASLMERKTHSCRVTSAGRSTCLAPESKCGVTCEPKRP